MFARAAIHRRRIAVRPGIAIVIKPLNASR
jgi:hypothetical protein